MSSATEKDPLLKQLEQPFADKGDLEGNVVPPRGTGLVSPSYLYRNFITMCIAFSFNHGCVVSCLAYSTAELGDELGSYGSGVLYIFYALTAFFLSKPVVSMIGPKNGLLAGVTGYCIYVAGFLFAILVPVLAWPVFLVACGIGGIAGGLLWTSQGRYFSRNAKLYSDESGEVTEKVNSNFAGVFATAYLGLEMVTKTMATVIALIFPESATIIIFTVYTCIAVASVFVVSFLYDLDESGTWDFSVDTIATNSLAAGKLVIEDPRLALMLPFQIAFGFASSFVPYYIFGTVIAGSDSLGSTYVGLLSAVIVFTGASTAIPAAWAANLLGKPPVMAVGGLCLAFAGFALFIVSNSQLGTWLLIIIYLGIYGMGRGTWENTNKAVIADLFTDTPDLSTAAFASISFFNGLAGAVGYFSFSSMSRLAMAGLVMVTSLVAIACYLVSVHIHQSNKTSLSARLEKYNS